MATAQKQRNSVVWLCCLFQHSNGKNGGVLAEIMHPGALDISSHENCRLSLLIMNKECIEKI